MSEIREQDNLELCWRAIPIQYDNYSQEVSDKYRGDVFGAQFGFESPHFLWRRFHKNMSKAMIISKLKNYSLKENEDDGFIYEISDHENVSFSVEILSLHQSLLMIVSAFEAYLKDSFIEVLKLTPTRFGNQKIEKIVRKYNFQNIESINRAFSWLFENEMVIVDAGIEQGLTKRHKIIHQSFYDCDFSESELDQYYINFLMQAEKLHDYLEEYGYYSMIKNINE